MRTVIFANSAGCKLNPAMTIDRSAPRALTPMPKAVRESMTTVMTQKVMKTPGRHHTVYGMREQATQSTMPTARNMAWRLT